MYHRRRMTTEAKAKVVAAAWGIELIQFLAALAFLHHDDLKKRMNKITATWRDGWLKKWLIHIASNHHPPMLPGLTYNCWFAGLFEIKVEQNTEKFCTVILVKYFKWVLEGNIL